METKSAAEIMANAGVPNMLEGRKLTVSDTSAPKRVPEKTYLGDSVYAELENGGLKLTTENGGPFGASNTIFLEPEVYEALVRYAERCKP